MAAAALVLDEARLIAEATGHPAVVNAPMILAAWRGDEAQASELIDASSEEAARRRWASNNYARAVLYNGLGRHDAARDAAWEPFEPDPIGYGSLLVPELAEAASRTDDRASLQYALDWLSERTRVISSGWASGIEARVRALLSEGEVADGLYRRSIEHLSGTRLRLELARTHLLYGEWLRRERRRLDARKHLRTALEAFTSMGAEAFGSRAERELLATGERARNERWRRWTSSLRRKRRSRVLPRKARPTERSPRGCSSVRAPSSTTCARCSASSREVADGARTPDGVVVLWIRRRVDVCRTTEVPTRQDRRRAQMLDD